MNKEIKETKLKELEEQLNQQKEYYTKLAKEIEIVLSNIKTLDGAIQGFKLYIQMDQGEGVNAAHDTGIVTDIVENT